MVQPHDLFSQKESLHTSDDEICFLNKQLAYVWNFKMLTAPFFTQTIPAYATSSFVHQLNFPNYKFEYYISTEIDRVLFNLLYILGARDIHLVNMHHISGNTHICIDSIEW